MRHCGCISKYSPPRDFLFQPKFWATLSQPGVQSLLPGQQSKLKSRTVSFCHPVTSPLSGSLLHSSFFLVFLCCGAQPARWAALAGRRRARADGTAGGTEGRGEGPDWLPGGPARGAAGQARRSGILAGRMGQNHRPWSPLQQTGLKRCLAVN